MGRKLMYDDGIGDEEIKRFINGVKGFVAECFLDSSTNEGEKRVNEATEVLCEAIFNIRSRQELNALHHNFLVALQNLHPDDLNKKFIEKTKQELKSDLSRFTHIPT